MGTNVTACWKKQFCQNKCLNFSRGCEKENLKVNAERLL